MLESDNDRLEMIKSLGGVSVRSENGEFVAIFDAAYVESQGVDETGPALSSVRSIDLLAAQVRKGSVLQVYGGIYRVRVIEPDGTGMSVVRLGA